MIVALVRIQINGLVAWSYRDVLALRSNGMLALDCHTTRTAQTINTMGRVTVSRTEATSLPLAFDESLRAGDENT
jgi:hypothetical protein